MSEVVSVSEFVLSLFILQLRVRRSRYWLFDLQPDHPGARSATP